MIFDFCDCRAQPKIKCDKVCTDHNPVKNLISSDQREKNAGFIAENFVRPPVSVTVQFPCNIELFRVIINPSVGAQKSCGFEIYTCSNKVKEDVLLSEQSCQVFCNDLLFVPVGKILIQDNGIICFSNHQFLLKNETDRRLLPSLEQYKHHGYLRHGRQSALTFVSHLTVRVTSTFSGSAVCIRQLQIWGRPSKSCSCKVLQTLTELFKPKIHSNEQDTKESKSEVTDSSSFKNDFEIPEDFLDSITHEIMTVPMRLPCGKNIDQSTLEKHNSSEAAWGRMPSDPFTGLTFDSKRKVQANVPLKGRIDKFVLANMDKLKNVPRTLGSCLKNGPSVSRLTNETANAYTSSTSLFSDKQDVKQTVLNNSEDYRTGQIIKLDDEEGVPSVSKHLQLGKKRKFKDIQDFETNPLNSSSSQNSMQDEVIDLTVPNSANSSNIHTTDLKHSLNSALASTLSTLPSFTKSAPKEKRGHRCSSCNKAVQFVAYKMPCSHLICRTCLLELSNEILCKLCNMLNNRKDIIRTHL